jgi:hypothetical protein
MFGACGARARGGVLARAFALPTRVQPDFVTNPKGRPPPPGRSPRLHADARRSAVNNRKLNGRENGAAPTSRTDTARPGVRSPANPGAGPVPETTLTISRKPSKPSVARAGLAAVVKPRPRATHPVVATRDPSLAVADSRYPTPTSDVGGNATRRPPVMRACPARPCPVTPHTTGGRRMASVGGVTAP